MAITDFLAAPGFSHTARMLQDSAKKAREASKSGDISAFGPGEGVKERERAQATNVIGDTLDAASEALVERERGGDKFKMAKEIAETTGDQIAKSKKEMDERHAKIAMENFHAARNAALAERAQNKALLGEILKEPLQGVLGGGLSDASNAVDNFVGKQELKGRDSLATGVKGIATLAKIAIPFLFCWVAREVHPTRWKDCRTYILFGSPDWFRALYIKRGEETAKWLRSHTWAKPLLYPLFSYFAWRGQKMAEKNPTLIELQSHLP